MTSDPLDAAYDATWTRFQTLTSLSGELNTVESAWSRGRSEYLAFLIPIRDPSSVAYIRSLVRELDRIPGVEPYPEPYWHVTIKGVGFLADESRTPDEISREQLNNTSALAADVFATQPPFDITLQRVNGFAEVVIIELGGGMPVRTLNGGLLQAIPGIYRQPFDGRYFLPHISIARYTSSEGLPELKRTLARLRQLPTGPSLHITEVDLIRAELTSDVPILHPLDRFPLGVSRSPA